MQVTSSSSRVGDGRSENPNPDQLLLEIDSILSRKFPNIRPTDEEPETDNGQEEERYLYMYEQTIKVTWPRVNCTFVSSPSSSSRRVPRRRLLQLTADRAAATTTTTKTERERENKEGNHDNEINPTSK